jgi:hypothetical protein
MSTGGVHLLRDNGYVVSSRVARLGWDMLASMIIRGGSSITE